MDSEKLTRKYYSNYSKIISLPDVKALLSFNAVESVLIFIRGLEIGLLYFYAFIIYFAYIILIFRKKIKISLLMMLTFSMVYLLLSFTLIPYVFVFGAFIPLINYPLLLDHSEKTAILLSTFSGILPSLLLSKVTLMGLIYVLIVSLLTYLYIYEINRRGDKIIGIPSLAIIKPFLRAMNYKRDEELESFLEKISIPTIINVATFKIGDVYFVLPQIHFGIYGNIGSSRFPYQVEEILSNAIVFHTPGSHELDLPSKRESRKVALEILKTKFEKLKFAGIEAEKIGDFEIVSLRFDKATLSFVQRPVKGIDDLPGALWRDMILRRHFLIDCHNEVLMDEIGNKEYLELKNFVSRSVKAKEEASLKIGYAEDRINCEGLCKDRIRVITLVGNKKLSIVYIYANNACRGLSQKIEESLSDLVDYALLVTPDDHSCTASSLGNLYQPARSCDELIEKARRLTIKALEDARKVDDIGFGIVQVKTKVIGKIISLMVKGLEEVGNFTLKTFWIPIVLPYAILVLILFTNSVVKL